MKNQLLRLIKGLKKFTPDDLCQMAELDENTVLQYLEEFVNEGIIVKTGSDSFTMLEKIPQRQAKRKKNVKAQKIEEAKKLLLFTEEEIEKFKNAPEWARKPAEKYLKVIYVTQGMDCKKRKLFLDGWNKAHPDMKMSYSALNRAKQRLREEGLLGLLSKYSLYNKGQCKVKGKMYEKFKQLYLSPDAPTFQSCYRQAKEEFSEYFEDWNFPSYLAFVRKIRKDFTEEEIEKFRMKNIDLERIFSSLREYS